MPAGVVVYATSLLVILLLPFLSFLNYPGRAFWVLALASAVNLIGAHMTMRHYA
jgi:hypothetical protein